MRTIVFFLSIIALSSQAQGPFYQVNTDVSETIQDLFFKDSLTGYGVGGSDSWGSSQSSGGFILKTTDGGENWITIFSADSMTIWSVAVVQENSHTKLYAFARKDTSLYLVSTTLDTPSQTWSLTPINYRPREVKVYNDIIYFADGVDSKLKKIDDGVLSTIDTNRNDYGYIFDVNQYGLLYLDGTPNGPFAFDIMHSPDFGVTTTSLDYFPPGSNIFGTNQLGHAEIKRIGDIIILKGTYSSSVVYSTDNGANWSYHTGGGEGPSLITNSSLIFSFLYPSGGEILLTSDLGQNWTALDTIYALHDLYYLEENDAVFVYGENGTIYKATQIGGLGTDNDGVHTPGERIRLFPNPAGETLQIEGHGAIRSLDVLDIRGRQVEAEYHRDSGTINTSRLPAGIYFLRVVLKNGHMESFKFEVM